jgi:peptide/nickel transport system permease protein
MTSIEAIGRARATRRLNPTVARYLSAFRTPRGIIGLTMLGILVLAAVLAPVLFPGGYDQQGSTSLTGMSAAHPFGLDEFGRDILARSVGEAVQRLFDVVVGFPGLLLGICLVAVLGPGWLALFLTILISGMPTAGRLARAAWLSQQSREYVLAARVLGVPRGKLLTRHIVPNAMDSIVVNGSVWMVIGVYIEAGLSIVGLGVQPPTPSLGVLLNNGLRFVTQAPTYLIGPGLILLLLALSFSLVADALNEAVNR